MATDLTRLRLRPFTPADVAALVPLESEFDDFGPRSPLREPHPHRWEEPSGLVVTEVGPTGAEQVLGSVTWYRPFWGPGEGSRGYGIGIGLLAEARGRGVGTWAQATLAAWLFRYTPTHRVEASTDITNAAEQRSLERAGFTREGVVRGAQWRLGAWHDLVLYGRLRDDPDPLQQ